MSNPDLSHGSSFNFGFQPDDGPVITIGGTAFSARKASLKAEPEIYATATNGNNQVEAVAISDNANRKITGTFTGYISIETPGAYPMLVGAISGDGGGPVGFQFASRFFFIKSISDPRNKGEYTEADIEVESHPLINS